MMEEYFIKDMIFNNDDIITVLVKPRKQNIVINNRRNINQSENISKEEYFSDLCDNNNVTVLTSIRENDTQLNKY